MGPLKSVSRERTTRRGFLGLAATGAALAALARLPAALAQATEPRRTFFSAHEREILTQVVERMVATDDPRAPAVRDTRGVDVIEGICAGLDPEVSGVLPFLLRVVELGPLLFDFRFKRFSKMSAAERDESLRAWMTSRLALRRRAFYALRNLAHLGYYSQEETWPLLGYGGPLIGRDGVPL